MSIPVTIKSQATIARVATAVTNSTVPATTVRSGTCRGRMFVLTWNQRKSPVPEDKYEQRVIDTAAGVAVVEDWPTGARTGSITKGDDVVLLVHGSHGGIVAVGQAAADADSTSSSITVSWRTWVAPEDGLPIEALHEVAPNFFGKPVRSSGRRISDDEAVAVKQAWAIVLGDSMSRRDEAGAPLEVGRLAYEGAVTRAEVNRYKRSAWARERCLQIFGYTMPGVRHELRGALRRLRAGLHPRSPLDAALPRRQRRGTSRQPTNRPRTSLRELSLHAPPPSRHSARRRDSPRADFGSSRSHCRELRSPRDQSQNQLDNDALPSIEPLRPPRSTPPASRGANGLMRTSSSSAPTGILAALRHNPHEILLGAQP